MSTTTTPPSFTINNCNGFDIAVDKAIGDQLHAESLGTFQVSLCLSCNMSCRHCHVASSPNRTEQMDCQTMNLVIEAAKRANAHTIDITGGAPETNKHFRQFITTARQMGFNVLVRSNLTILLTTGYMDLPEFLRDNSVGIIASLPCYLEENVDKQRGRGTHAKSIRAIKKLNELGYGIKKSLPLALVYNPLGPVLPLVASELEKEYRRELANRWRIKFSRLITMTNMPIGRFRSLLKREGKLDKYMQLLRDRFNQDTVNSLMCRGQVHVSHDGTLHDCDFNYALGLTTDNTVAQHISDFDPATHINRRIVTGEHCFGCTAGHGSSCGGALA